MCVTSIIVILPKIEDAKTIKNVLVRNGHQVAGIYTSAAQALSAMDFLDYGVVICGYKMADMIYSQLYDSLPKGFEMLLMASKANCSGLAGTDIVCLNMPLKVQELLDTVDLMSKTMAYKRKKEKSKPKERNEDDKILILEAKKCLMLQNDMTEEEAHRYIQKRSMDSGTNIVDMARKVLESYQ